MYPPDVIAVEVEPHRTVGAAASLAQLFENQTRAIRQRIAGDGHRQLAHDGAATSRDDTKHESEDERGQHRERRHDWNGDALPRRNKELRRRRLAGCERGRHGIAAGQRRRDGQRRRRPLLRILLQTSQNHPLHGRIEVAYDGRRRGQRCRVVQLLQVAERFCLVRALPREDLEQDQAEGEDIALGGPGPAGEQLRRHVLRSTGDAVVPRLRPAVAIPKSAMRTSPFPSSITFAGFRSRCSTPFSCAAAIPAHSCRAICTALSGGIRPKRRSDEDRSSPSTYSIVRKRRPSASPRSYNRQTFLCDTCRATRSSLWNCAIRRSVAATPSGRNFSATGWSERQVVGAVHLAHAAAAQQGHQPVATSHDCARRKS